MLKSLSSTPGKRSDFSFIRAKILFLAGAVMLFIFLLFGGLSEAGVYVMGGFFGSFLLLQVAESIDDRLKKSAVLIRSEGA